MPDNRPSLADQGDPALGQAFLFDPEDLAWNRQGRLSPSQAQMLANTHTMGRSRRRTVLVLLVLAPIAAIAYVMVTTQAQGIETDEAWQDRIPWIVVAAMAPFLLLIGVLVWFGGRRSKRLLTPVLQRAEGPARKRDHATSPGNGIRSTTIRIGDFRYRVFTDMADEIVEGAWYEAYYVEGETTILLSMARLA